MSPGPALVSIAALHLLAMASPGPNVLLVAQTGMTRSRRCALAAAGGVASGGALLAAVAALGLSVVFEQAGWLRLTIQIAGGAYLIALGIRTWRSARDPLPEMREAGDSGDEWRYYRRGLITNLTNPKAAVFYGSVLAAALKPELPTWARFAAVGLIAVNSTWWHSALAVLFSRPRAQGVYRRAKGVVDRVVGAGLAALGARLALSR